MTARRTRASELARAALPGPLRAPAAVSCALAAVFLLSIASVSFAPEDSEVAAWWPAAGVASGLLALSGRDAWTKLVPALVLVSALANAVSGRDVWVALLFGVANTAESVVVALVLGAHVSRPWLRSREDVGRLVNAAVLGASTAGVLAGATVVLVLGGDLVTAAIGVAASHAASQLLVLPAVLLATDPQAARPQGGTRPLRLLLVVVTLVAFTAVHAGDQTLPLVFAPFLLLVVAAQVLALRSLAWTSLASGLVVTVLTAQGDGPFAVSSLSAATVGALVQVDLVVIALVSLPLGIAVAQASAARRGLERDSETLRTALARERDVVERLEELDRVKSEFLSTVSHELRTPLTSIIGFTEVLAHETAGPVTPGQARALQRIDRGARRLVGLIENVLVISRVEEVGTRRLRSTVDMTDVVRRALLGAEHLLFDRSVTLRLHVVPGATDVGGDAEQLERAVLNLLTNAIKFTRDGGTVDVTVGSSTSEPGALGGVAPRVTVTVDDTGIGIDPADQPRLFERFFRADSALDGSVAGTGLGLSIVRAVIEEHDGSVDLTSTPGEGTTVVISLPPSAG